MGKNKRKSPKDTSTPSRAPSSTQAKIPFSDPRPSDRSLIAASRPLVPFFLPGSNEENVELIIPSPISSKAPNSSTKQVSLSKKTLNRPTHHRYATSSIYISPSPDDIPLPKFVVNNNIAKPKRLDFHRNFIGSQASPIEENADELSRTLLEMLLK